jgi:hypothetical protein
MIAVRNSNYYVLSHFQSAHLYGRGARILIAGNIVRQQLSAIQIKLNRISSAFSTELSMNQKSQSGSAPIK